MGTVNDLLAKARERVKQLEAKKRQQEARERAKKAKVERAKDTRRKVLVGAVVLGKVSRGELPESQLKEWLGQALTRSDDRALFDLAPLPTPATDAPPVSDAKPAPSPT